VAGARDFNRAESRSGGELEHVAPARSPAGDGARDQVTPDGRRMLDVWMRTVLAVPAREFPDFPAALSLVAAAEPGEVRALLEARAAALEARLAELEQPVPGLPRVFLLENEYMAAVVRAEIAWLRAVIGDLRARRLTWSAEGLRRLIAEWAAQGTAPPGAAANLATDVAEKPRAVRKAHRRHARKPRRTKRARQWPPPTGDYLSVSTISGK